MACTNQTNDARDQRSDVFKRLIPNTQPSTLVPEPRLPQRAPSSVTLYSYTDDGYHQCERSFDGLSRNSQLECALDVDGSQEVLPPSGSTHGSCLWEPFWLRRSVLLSLAALFTILWVALIILWRFSTIENGISLRLTTNQYAWTYGPTIILVVVVCLWRQVDYNCKILSPWHNLAVAPAPASQTVLLDYVSLLQVTALVKAVRLGNYSVVFSVLGFGLLKLTLIFSTGLLVATPTSFTDSISPLIVTTKFDALSLNSSIQYNPLHKPSIDVSVNGNHIVYAYYAAVLNGMNPLEGTYRDSTFQSFHQADKQRNATNITAEVQVFQPTTRCEIGTVKYTNITDDAMQHTTQGGATYIKVDTPTCHLGYGNVIDRTYYNMIGIPIRNPTNETCAPRELTPYMVWTNCSTPSRTSNSSVYDARDGDYRWLMTLSDIRYVQTFGPEIEGKRQITSGSRYVANVTALLCSIEYQMTRLPVTYSYSPNGPSSVRIPTISKASPLEQLDGLKNTQLNQVIMQALGASSSMFPLRRKGKFNYSDGRDILFGLMDRSLNGDGSYEMLLPGTDLQHGAELTLNGLSKIVAHNALLREDNTNITGSMVYTVDRLHVRGLSLWFMISLFILMTVLTLLIIVYRPCKVVSCDPDSLGASAAILKSSNSAFQGSITHLGYNRESFIRTQLSNYMFATNMGKGFGISIVNKRATDPKKLPQNGPYQKRGQWYPWAARYPLLFPTFLMPTAAIIGLEILQRISDRHNGVVTITSKTTENIYYYITSLVMLLTATMYNNLDFNIACFAPFSSLRANSLPAKHGVMFHLLGQIPIFALWRTLKARLFGASLSNIVGFIGSTLTIIASGLWLLDSNCQMSQKFSIHRADTWNTTRLSAINDNNAALVYSLINNQNLSYPSWTFDELAFPRLVHDLSSNTASEDFSTDGGVPLGTEYRFTLPTLRANLRCTIGSADRITSRWYKSPGLLNIQEITASLPLPIQCLEGPGRNVSSTNITVQAVDRGPSSPGQYFALLSTVYCKEQNTYEGDPSANNISSKNPTGCPSLAFMFGYVRFNSTPPENITAMICRQELQELKVDLTLKQDVNQGSNAIPIIDPSMPPVPDETSIRLLTNGTPGRTSFPWDPSYNLQQGLQVVQRTRDHSQFNKFFDLIFNSTDDSLMEGYMRSENAVKLIKAINHAYRQYMAQVINLNMRAPRYSNGSSSMPGFDNGAESATTFSGRKSISIARLKVNSTTKLVLQICLAVMTLFGLAAFSTVSIRGTLNHNPCTIVGKMTLLAGSELVDGMPEGSEYLSEKELSRVLSENGLLYSLGWWDKSGGKLGSTYSTTQGRRFGVDIGLADPIR